MMGIAFVAMLAGGINAIAGGGTIFLFPALLAVGVPAVEANASSTLALVVGASGSFVGYGKQMREVRGEVWRFAPVCLLGSLLGAWLLTHSSEAMFEGLVPYLILFATLLFMAKDWLRRFFSRVGSGETGFRVGFVGMVVQGLIAIYGGYFGAAIGILMLSSLSFLGMDDLHRANALKNVLGVVINVVAAVWFVCDGLIDWGSVWVMIPGAWVGYGLSSYVAQKVPVWVVRRLVTVVGLAIAGFSFYRGFV